MLAEHSSGGSRVAMRDSGGSRTGLGLWSPHAIIGSLCSGLIVIGLISRNELDLSPKDGLGYNLGIIGTAAMTLLMGYSLRKRIKLFRNAGGLRGWFEIHLILGLLGPTAILYHSGFRLGSMNSTVSLMCVLAVSGSGIAGRFLYGRMHRSLAGSRRSTEGFLRQAMEELKHIESTLERTPAARGILHRFASFARKDASLFILPIRVLVARPRAWWKKHAALRKIKKSARPQVVPSAVRQAVSEYFSLLCRGMELRLFERLFALWHAIHVPLTVILFVSATIHVVAVHLY